MRNHENLAEMISRETDNPTPNSAARLLKSQAPAGATHAILYKNRSRPGWVVMFAPSDEFPTLLDAKRSRVSGKKAAATCPL